MKLLTNRHSPYGRKAVATVHELNLTDVAIEHEETSPTKKNTAVSDHNPLGKIPILLTNDAGPIFDSDVICQYLCQLSETDALLPSDPRLRTHVLRQQALASGLCEAGIAVRWEIERRPMQFRYGKFRDGQVDKLVACYSYLEENVPDNDEVTLGTLALSCALDWLKFRDLNHYAERHPKLEAWLSSFLSRPSLAACPFAGETHD